MFQLFDKRSGKTWRVETIARGLKSHPHEVFCTPGLSADSEVERTLQSAISDQNVFWANAWVCAPQERGLFAWGQALHWRGQKEFTRVAAQVPVAPAECRLLQKSSHPEIDFEILRSFDFIFTWQKINQGILEFITSSETQIQWKNCNVWNTLIFHMCLNKKNYQQISTWRIWMVYILTLSKNSGLSGDQLTARLWPSWPWIVPILLKWLIRQNCEKHEM